MSKSTDLWHGQDTFKSHILHVFLSDLDVSRLVYIYTTKFNILSEWFIIINVLWNVKLVSNQSSKLISDISVRTLGKKKKLQYPLHFTNWTTGAGPSHEAGNRDPKARRNATSLGQTWTVFNQLINITSRSVYFSFIVWFSKQ